MKRIFTALSTATVLALSLSACGSSNDSGGDEASGSTYQQVQESGT